MNAERFRRLCEAFEAARNAPPAEQDEVIRRHCAGDDTLAAEAREMLRHHVAGDGALDRLVEPAARRGAGDVVDGYRLLEQLGEGGMGTVFRAEAPDGACVALKILHPHLAASGGSRERFLREARLGAGVRHPAVVRVLHADIAGAGAGATPYMVMEYVEGQSLRELLDEIGRASEDLCRHVARELADALASIHAAGAVHRDLKPDNVLITPDHQVKLTDLGVAHLPGASVDLSQTGAFIGSLCYASPEQFHAERDGLDGRSDLHALGIVMYELASGENPFAGEAFATVMQRVLHVVPPRLGTANPQVSTYFEEVVHTLLEKDRAARFRDAAELRDVLDAGEDAPWWRVRRGERRRGVPRRIRPPRDTALYGRDDALAQLDDAFAAAAQGRGAAVLIDGEPGIGKTRLLDEAIGRFAALPEPPEVLFGGNPPVAVPGSRGALLTALRDHFDPEAVRARLTELLPDAPSLATGLAALILDDAGAPGLSHDAAESAIVRVVQTLAKARPLVVVLDDLHFAPAEEHALFLALAHAVQGHAVLLVGTARPGLPDRLVSALTSLRHGQRVALQRLGPRDLARLLSDALRSERLADELGWQMARKSDGNPFFVFEILRELRESGKLRRSAEGAWSTTGILGALDVPSSVTELIEARISELSEEEQELLDVASCCGFEFAPALVAEALTSARIPVLRALGRIERHHRLVRASGPHFVFDHHQVQETIYARLSPALRAEYHRVLGEVQERRLRTPPEDVSGATAAQLAGHFVRGESAERARPYLPAALDYIEPRSREEAAALGRSALAAPDGLEGAARLAVLRRMIDTLEHLGRHEETESNIDAALALAEELDDREAVLEVLARRGWFHVATGRAEAADGILRAALEEARAHGFERIECVLLRHLGAAASERSRFEEAEERLQQSLALARRLGADDLETLSLGVLGSVAWFQGDYETSRACDERALELAVKSGDKRREAVAVGNLGTMYTSAGDYSRSLEMQRRRLRISREIGYRRGAAIATGNLGLAMSILGRPDEALALHEAQIALCREIGHRRGEAAGLFGLSIAHVAGGRIDDADRACRDGVEAVRDMDAAGLRAMGEQLSGDILQVQGRLDDARARFETAYALADEAGVAIEAVIARLLAAQLPHVDGDAARRVYEEKRDRLPLRVRMHAEHLMYRLTGDRAHLDAAWERLRHLRDHAPLEYRESMMRDQPLHRAIAADVEAAATRKKPPPSRPS